jgi:hypothetical protein
MPRPAPYGYSRSTLALTIPFTGFLSVATQVNLVLSKLLGFKAELEKVELVTTVVGTGAGATRLINIRKGSATGTVVGTITPTLANQGVLGVVLTGAVVTAGAANKFDDADTVTVELPAAGTAFSAGGGDLILTFRQLHQRAS